MSLARPSYLVRSFRLLEIVVEECAYWLIQYGISYSTVQSLIRRGYARAAERDLKRRGKTPSQREIYRLCGLYPKAYREAAANLETLIDPDRAALSSLVEFWQQQKPYGHKGIAEKLPISNITGKNFKSLCRQVLPDFSYKSLLHDLIDYGVVTLHDDYVVLNKTRAVPSKSDSLLFEDNIRSMHAHISAINHNLNVDDHADGAEYHKHLERWVRMKMPLSSIQHAWQISHDVLSETMGKLERIFDTDQRDQTSQKEGCISAGIYLHIDPPLKDGKTGKPLT